MPRNRPGHVHSGLPPRGTVDGLSARAQSEISRLEHTRNHLRPGDTGRALRLWATQVRRPARQLWHDHEFGSTDQDCCGDPYEARALLDTVARAA